MKKSLLVFLSSGFVLSVTMLSPVFAQETDVDELKNQVKALETRVEQLEKENQAYQQREQNYKQDRQGFFDEDWDPFSDMQKMRERMNRLFNDISISSQGQVEDSAFSDNDFQLEETKDGYTLRIDISQLNKDKVDVEINPNSITISGEYSQKTQQEGQNKFYSTQKFGSFLQTIPLPVDADTNKSQTNKEGDTLLIKIPKKV